MGKKQKNKSQKFNKKKEQGSKSNIKGKQTKPNEHSKKISKQQKFNKNPKFNQEHSENKSNQKVNQKFNQTQSENKKPNSKLAKPIVGAITSKDSKLSSLQLKMKDQLESSRFRWINEQLYTSTSDEALELMKESPEYFDVYHKGYRTQVFTFFFAIFVFK
jgi:ribosomal RNA-processing protein 8